MSRVNMIAKLAGTALLTLIISTSAQAGIVTYLGDSIGTDPGWVDGRNANSATLLSQGFGYSYEYNLGTPAFSYTSDGKATLNNLRVVSTVILRTTSPVDWSRHNWQVHIWSKDGYFAKADPLQTVQFGSTPSNWSDFKTLADGSVVPDTDPFGTPANAQGQHSYDMRFDLSQQAAMQSALPAGEYIIGITSSSGVNGFGEAGLLSTSVGIGPTPYYSATAPTRNIDPGLVYPRLTTDEDFRWAMNLDIESNLLNGTFDESLTHWNTGGEGAVDVIEVDGNKLTRFTAGSPAILSQSIITDPSELLSFDYLFEQPAGQFDVLLGSDLIASLSGEDLFSLDWTNFSMTLDDPNLWGRQDELRFVFDGPTGSVGYLDNISLGSASAVPEPSGLVLLATGIGAVALARRRRRDHRDSE